VARGAVAGGGWWLGLVVMAGAEAAGRWGRRGAVAVAVLVHRD
jgi:hypothetical protein